MANPTSTQRLRQLFQDDEDEKKEGGAVQVKQAEQGTDFSRADNVANSLRQSFSGFGETAPSRVQKTPEAQPVEFAEAPKKVFDWKAGGNAFIEAIKDVPRQTMKGLGMILDAPTDLAQFGSDQLMKNDSYNQFMTDAARGIDLGEGRAAVAVLNTGALGIGDVKPVMNTETGKAIMEKQADYTSNLPLKAVARFRAIGDESYQEVRDRMLEARYDPNNSLLTQTLYDIQDSGVQSGIGILVSLGATAATRNPKAGLAVGGLYYAGLSGGEQIQERGEVYSSSNIAIDTVGDTLINNALLGVFKAPAAALARIPATAGLEGLTEVTQSLLKFSNLYARADSDQERDEILEDAANYVKSGAIVREFAVGAVVGGVAQTAVEIGTRGEGINFAAPEGTIEERMSSLQNNPDQVQLFRGQDQGSGGNHFTDNITWAQNFGNQQNQEIVTGKLPANAEIKVLTDVDMEVAFNQLGMTTDEEIYAYYFDLGYDAVLGTDSRNSAEVDVIVNPKHLANFSPIDTTNVLGTAEEVTSVTGKGKSKEAPDVFKQIEEVSDLIARANRGETLTQNEQVALSQAQQSFNDYANVFQVTQFNIPSDTQGQPNIAQVQTVPVGDKVAVKYVSDVGETGLNIDYDLNSLYNSPQEATDAAVATIATWAQSQLENPNISPETRNRLEDLVEKVRNSQRSAVPQTPAEQEGQAQTTAPVVGGLYYYDGVQYRIGAVVATDKGVRLRLESPDVPFRYINLTETETGTETSDAVEAAEEERDGVDEETQPAEEDTREAPVEGENVEEGESKKSDKKEPKKTAKTKAKKATTDKKKADVKSNVQEKTNLIGRTVLYKGKEWEVRGQATDADIIKIARKGEEANFVGIQTVEVVAAPEGTVEATAEKLMDKGKPEAAEKVRNNADALVIVPTKTQVEIEVGEAAGQERGEVKVRKQAMKDFVAGRDRVVFTVIDGGVVDGKSTVVLYEKRENGESRLKPEALGLVPAGLKIGQEVIIDAKEMRKAGSFYAAVNKDGDVEASVAPKKGSYKNAVIREGDILDTFDAQKVAGYYTSEQRRAIFEAVILPKLKKINSLADDEVVVYYQPANGDGGQYVNLDLARVWWVAGINGDFEVKKVKEWELVTTGAEPKDLVGERIYYPKEDFMTDADGRVRERATGRFAPKDSMRSVAVDEFAAVSKRVQKAEPADQMPSRFLNRMPEKKSQAGDVTMNEEALKQGDKIELDKVVKRQEIARVLKNQLNAVVRYGKFRNKALGIYKRNSKVIRMANKGFDVYETRDLAVLIHEMGHFLDFSIQEFRGAIPQKELAPLLENYGTGYKSVPTGKKHSEAFAEFLRYYLTEPEQAKQRAPKFHEYFENALNGLPEIRDAFTAARRDIERWKAQPSAAKVAAQINFDGKNRQSRVQEMFTSTTEMYRHLVDDLTYIQDFDKDVYMHARNLRGWAGRAQYFLEFGTVSGDFYKKGDNGQMYIDRKGKSLKEILQPVEKKGALTDLSVYLVARRSVELAGRGINSGVSEADARATVNEMVQKFPEFEKIAGELDTYQTSLLEYLKESGVLSKESFDQIKELNQMYVPFYRVYEELQEKGHIGGSQIPVNNPLKRIKGSEFEIIDPIESIIRNTYTLINTAERNKVMLEFRAAAAKNPDLAQKFEKVPVDQTKVASVNPKEIVYQALGANSEMAKMLLPNEVQQAIDIVVPETLVNIFRPAFIQKGNVVTVNVDGKTEYYVADKDLYKSIQGLDREQVALWVRLAATPARFLRAGAVLAPDFMIRNPLRDAGQAFITSKNGFIPILDTVRGLASVLKKDQYYQAWLISGGDLSTLVSQDREDVRTTRDELLKTSAQIKKYVMNPLEALRYISNLSEQATRVGEARLALINGKSPTEAAFDAREVASDFGRHGASTQSISMMAAFFNARIQGLDILIRRMKEDPIGTSLRGTFAYTIPSILLYLANRDDDEYREIPRWQKDLFWLVKAPDGVWLRIPKPFEVGTIFATLPERFLEYIDKDDPRALDGLFELLVTKNIPNPFPTAVTPWVENITNYSFFLERPIVSQTLENLPPEDQYTNTTSEAAKFLGDLANYSPAKIDNVLYGYFATLGRYTLNSVDAILKGTGIVHSVPEPTMTPADYPVVKAFVARDPKGSSSESVNQFYEEHQNVTQRYNKYKDLLEDGESDKAREYLVDYPEIKLYKAFNDVAKQISELRKVRDAIYESETLTPDEKREKIDEVNQLMTDTAYMAITLELEE